jgi:hypothetical protein
MAYSQRLIVSHHAAAQRELSGAGWGHGPIKVISAVIKPVSPVGPVAHRLPTSRLE